MALVTWAAFRPPVATSAADAARQRISKRLLLADAQSEAIVDEGPAAAELLETVIDGLKIELRRIRQANSNIMPPLMVTRGPKRAPVLNIQMGASAEFGLARDVRMEIVVTVIDVEAQAVRLAARASVPTDSAKEPVELISVFKGPYSSGATSDRVEAAVLVALDQAQNGTIGQLSIAELRVD